MSRIQENYISEPKKIPSNDPRFEHSNGRIFSDSSSVGTGRWVTGIRVTIGDRMVNSIQFIYDHDPGLSQCHGSGEGTLLEQHFADDEYITKFSWISGWNSFYANTDGAFTWNIQVTTNKSSYIFGEEPFAYYCRDRKRYVIEADEGHRLVGIRCKARRSDKDAQPTDRVGTAGIALNTIFAISDVYQCELNRHFTDIFYNDYDFAADAGRLTEIRGAVCDYCISRLQFIYDGDETLTNMHGRVKAGEQPFSIKFDPQTHLTGLKYQIAECRDPGYGNRTLLTYLFAETNVGSCYEIGCDKKSLPASFHHEQFYTLNAGAGKELWAFAGLYNEYMGAFLSWYERSEQ